MSLKLYFHPLSSFCQKALVALYENDTPFEPVIVDLFDAKSSAALKAIWPIGRFPVLRDEANDRTVPESSIIIEYLDQHYPGRTQLVPADAELARQTRLQDRFYDLYVNVPMQKVVTDKLRPSGKNDPHGVEAARSAAAHRLRHDRTGDGGEDLGHGRRLQHGRLRRGAGAVLRQHGDAARRQLPKRLGVSRPLDGSSVLRPRHQGSAALLRNGPEIAAAPPRQRSRGLSRFLDLGLPDDRRLTAFRGEAEGDLCLRRGNWAHLGSPSGVRPNLLFSKTLRLRWRPAIDFAIFAHLLPDGGAQLV